MIKREARVGNMLHLLLGSVAVVVLGAKELELDGDLADLDDIAVIQVLARISTLTEELIVQASAVATVVLL
jgi:hypothetical protein